MDRDAPAAPSPLDVIPPVEPTTVYRVGLSGLALATAAAVLGGIAAALGDNSPALLATARLGLVGVGAILAGFAVSLRGGLPGAWGIAAATAAVAIAGTPGHWDTLRFLFGVMGGFAVAAAVVVCLPVAARYVVISLALLFHFGGISVAVTSPPATPWVTEQLFHRVYLPYLQFLYLRNAYHFYSPEPGPASLLAFLVKTEADGSGAEPGQKTYDYQWVVFPRRPADLKDPLALGYMRRLSLTEQVARATPDIGLPQSFERDDVRRRRDEATYVSDPARGGREVIPPHPTDALATQYRVPAPDITRFLLPSYTRHVLLEHVPDEAKLKTATVKVYRLEHRTLNVTEFRRGPIGPYHPSTYKPFFLGEYDAHGTLLDPQEPMLFWQVPVIHRPGAAPGDGTDDFADYLSRHAGHKFDWSSLR